ncbi:hypothetical protein B0I35DRAFT_160509 [Stachybotrys elegans]|uniref:F-box domain-containing protein n=1 Tax=Stachybotrys elegans TaxID=80388 RepID=A0A8K0WVE4_9HYPO|nr:hypothetical protein B0I35DRAFT_160509 [Stachybotrys elegans]
MADNAATRGSSISFQNLPSELIDAILYWLPPHDLAMLSATCRALHKAATSDSHWRRCVQENVPFHLAKAPGSYVTSYRQLYAAYDRLWFLPKYKIWFSDRNLAGRLVIACFDPRRGCIDGYQLLAVSSERSYADWVGSEEDSEVKIHSFKPYVRLHLDRPIIHFGLDKSSMDFRNQEGNRYANAMPMALDDRENGMFSNFMLTKALDPVKVEEGFRQGFPYGSVWPPPCIPARCHAAGFLPGQPEESHSSYDRPQRRGEVSDQSFHIRQWMEMVGSPAAERAIARSAFNPLNRRHAYQNIGHGALSIHIGEELITYSTLDPSLYTPTPTKPWRGIWVGDYSGHGCEFLLLHQPDDEPATDSDLGLVREEGESDGSWEQRRLEARIYRGRLEAIKLTGDPNIPRGEYTFVADDLGPEGFVKFETAAPFEGVRVVKSKGHVARTGFEEGMYQADNGQQDPGLGLSGLATNEKTDMFISSHLMLLSHNRLAQYWLEFGHISYFERVNIDNFINPAASSF